MIKECPELEYSNKNKINKNKTASFCDFFLEEKGRNEVIEC